MLGKTVMAESGMGGQFWFSATMNGVNCRNATYKKRLGTTPHEKVYGTKKDVSKFRPFGCRVYIHLNKERREKGRHAPKGVEAINLGFATDCNTSGYKFYIEGTRKIITSNQGKFDELVYPYRNRNMIDKHIDDLSNIDVLTLDQGGITWVNYSEDMDLNQYEKVHSGGSSDSYILRSKSDPQMYMGIRREDFFKSLLHKRADELLVKARALVAGMEEEISPRGIARVKGLPEGIDPSKPPKNFKYAMSRIDRQQWAEAYDREYQGFYEHQTLKVARARPEPGTKVLGSTTRTEYKVMNGELKKYKVRLCVMGNQQKEGVHYKLGELYAPVMKAAEVRLFMAIAAQNGLEVFKSDTKQAFLNGEKGEEKIYICAPDWWPEPVPEGQALMLMKSMYGTRQAARQWHVRISTWMESHGYLAVNSEKTMFMKRKGKEWIVHGLFVDDMAHASTCPKLKKRFIHEYKKDVDITEEGIMSTFLGMEVEQSKDSIKLHLDTYIQETLDEYKSIFKKFLKPKSVPMQPGVMLDNQDCPETPDQREQKVY